MLPFPFLCYYENMLVGIDIRNIGKRRTGDEAVFFNLVKNLAINDNINEYWLFTDIVEKDILEDIIKNLEISERYNFKIISLKSANKFVWNLWTLPRYLRRNPVDVYHTQYILPFFVPRKIKLITTIHDISFNFFPQFIKKTDLFFLKILIPWSLKRADKIIAVSKFTKDEIVKFYMIASGKVEIAYNSVGGNFSQNYFPQEEVAATRIKYNLPEKFILYLGTMQPRKNLPFLIEAYAGIKDKIPGVKLVLAGRKSHNYDRKIDQLVVSYKLEKDVYFPGFIDELDKPIVFYLSQLFVFPSLYEGFGIPILEAMSQGVPVLAADIASLREVGEITALYFDPNDLASLKDKIYNVFIDENLRKKLINSGLERVNVFSWGKSARETIKIYNSLSNNK